MDFAFLFQIAFTLQIAATVANKYGSLSDESIENILYFKDCNHQKTEAPMKYRVEEPPPPRQPECIPKMCCSMSCANSCGQEPIPGPQPMFMPISNPIKPQPSPPFTQRTRKKKKTTQKPFGGRRSLGFTKEHIKSLISQDEDIKKILKELVRVTMQKADLIDMINARNAEKNVVVNQENPDDSVNYNNNASDEDDG